MLTVTFTKECSNAKHFFANNKCGNGSYTKETFNLSE